MSKIRKNRKHFIQTDFQSLSNQSFIMIDLKIAWGEDIMYYNMQKLVEPYYIDSERKKWSHCIKWVLMIILKTLMCSTQLKFPTKITYIDVVKLYRPVRLTTSKLQNMYRKNM